MTALRVGTRGSALALAQANWVAERIAGAELVVLRTSGDAGAAPGDKARWVDTIEAALTGGEIDLAVHSAKDVPGELAAGTEIVAAPVRASAFDVMLLGESNTGTEGMHAGGGGITVGTSSLRRRAQLLAAYPDVRVVDLRGNVDTRLRKLADGEVDAIVLAAAGLERLGLSERLGPNRRRTSGVDSAQAQARALEGGVFVPAPGQGTLALQARAGDARVRAAVAAIADAEALAHLEAERVAVRALDATCHTPVGVHATASGMRGFAGLPDGSRWVLDEIDTLDGALLAQRMLSGGAAEILAAAEAVAQA